MPVTRPAPGAVLELPRGGTVVATSAGPVQFGAPPETIKDALTAGLEVPAIFVLPTTWFSRRRGLTVAEVEFPVFYNYFVLGRRVTVVTDEAGSARMRVLLREALFGPEVVDSDVDYDDAVPVAARADLTREAEWFRRKGGDPRRHIDLDEVVTFATYDAAGRAALPGGVTIERLPPNAPGGRWSWQLQDGGRLLAHVEDLELERREEAPIPVPSYRAFTPPLFGLTVLGASHGFDPAGKTTGFVLWVGRRGVLVDPPTDSTEVLRAAGVPPDAVDTLILTHCHADHDAGVFQKVLEAGQVHVYTTPTILGSFLRKYVALTGESEERLRRLFVFRPVAIGAPQRIHGAEFRFFYSLHSIPTIGFATYFGGKSFVYSADTLYDPPRIEALHEEGILGRERRDALLGFPFHHSLVVHEAGVPPIHTPAARLAELPEPVKARLRIIHIAEAHLPEGAGLRLARTGFDETIVLPVADPPHAAALEALDALAAIDLFRDFTVERCREFLTIARRETYRSGALVIGQGEPGDRFYIIVAGDAVVVRDGEIVKTYRAGDFFGETALVTGAPRSADVRAKSELVALAIDKHDFLSFLRDTDVANALIRLARNRDLPSWDLMSDNPVLHVLSAKQRTRLQALLEHRTLAAGQVLWEPGGDADAAWLLDAAVVQLEDEGTAGVTLGRAALLADVEAVLRRRPLASRAVVMRAGGAFCIAAERLAEYLEQNPGLLLALSGTQFVAR